ncbi:hypothetical protein GCM10025853_23000 [Tetragenococcus halophilus subsp. halophilus DSM 20339]|nr:hypothetical protein C7K42_08445 [Tetragenococcus halophilus subsp. halophilus DSM 20339]GMA44843.1 hypothetical protein GCM10025853_23000 [Tetragenococcus halophilus subsp. halophilus DSM 20339]
MQAQIWQWIILFFYVRNLSKQKINSNGLAYRLLFFIPELLYQHPTIITMKKSNIYLLKLFSLVKKRTLIKK